MGVDNGWAIDNNGNTFLTPAVCAQISQGEAGWIRIEMRLIPGHTSWDPAMLGYYDTAVNNCRAAGLQVLLLIDGGSWPGSQSDWCANNYENTGGSGDNAYVDGFAASAVAPIVQHFHGRVKLYEIWNEPNAWTSSPSPGVFVGGTFLYPSNYSWMLSRSWVAVHQTNHINDVTLFFGGVLGHSIGGIYSYRNAGAQYVDDTYNVGINRVGSFASVMAQYGAYPLDGVGQHIYIDTGQLTSSANFQQYEDWVRSAYTRYEGLATSKASYITEFGWSTRQVDQSTQDANLVTAFQTIQATPYVRLGIWFQWKDNPAAGLYYGVLDSAGNPKLSYPDFQWLSTYEGVYADGTTNPDVQSYYYGLGQPVLGNPYDNGGSPWAHTWSDAGYSAEVQDCDGGADGRLCIMASVWGTFEVNDVHGLWDFYLAHGGIGFFGAPQDNEYAFGAGTRQDFESGHYLTWDPVNGVLSY